MRIKESAEVKDREYQKAVVLRYLKTHSDLSRQMVQDYKRYAVNKFLAELYCADGDNNPRYMGKNRDLIERAQFGTDDWRRAKVAYDSAMAATMASIEGENIPAEVKKSIQLIYGHYQKYALVRDLDDRAAHQLGRIFGGEEPETESEEEEEAGEGEEEEQRSPSEMAADKDATLAPGELILKIKRQSPHFAAADNIYRATRTVRLPDDFDPSVPPEQYRAALARQRTLAGPQRGATSKNFLKLPGVEVPALSARAATLICARVASDLRSRAPSPETSSDSTPRPQHARQGFGDIV